MLDVLEADGPATACVVDPVIQNGAEKRRAKSAAEVSREHVRGRRAAPLMLLDDLLYQHQRTDADEAHPEAHDERSKSRQDFTRGFEVPIKDAGAALAVVLGTSQLLGLLAGGAVADRLGQRDARWAFWTCALGASPSLPGFAIALFWPHPVGALIALFPQLGKLSRNHDLAKAINYMLRRWNAFTRFLDDGRICLTNNAAERALRCVPLGRKAWLFCGSDRGGQRAAILYTLIQTARLNDVDPQAWLADVFARIADQPVSSLDELLPWNWQPSATAIAA